MGAHAPMLGRLSADWCPYCRDLPGPDCPSRGRAKRSLKRMSRAEVRRAWAQAWLEGR